MAQMAQEGKGFNKNGSQFFIIFDKTPWLDYKHVVFGRVCKGLEYLEKIENVELKDDKPENEIKIVDCGEIVQEKDEEEEDKNKF